MKHRQILKFLLGPACLLLISFFFPTKVSAAPYYLFYQKAHTECSQTATMEGVDHCPKVIAGCLESIFECAQNTPGCTLQSGSDGLFISCEENVTSPYESCIPTDLTPQITKLIEEGACDAPFEPGALAMSQPGCGNMVKEWGETCDDGNTMDGDNCPYNCVDPKALCGNGTLDPGETCDAGKENGKFASGCDIECKKFPTGDTVATADSPDLTSTTDQLNGSQAATGSCSLTSWAQGTQIPNLFLLLFGSLPLLIQFRRINL